MARLVPLLRPAHRQRTMPDDNRLLTPSALQNFTRMALEMARPRTLTLPADRQRAQLRACHPTRFTRGPCLTMAVPVLI